MSKSEFKDRHVSYISEARIAEHAHFWRSAHGNSYGWKFNVFEFLNYTFLRKFKHKISIKHFARADYRSAPVYVEFDSGIIWIDDSIWALARAESAYAQFVLAHEVGHLVLHSNLPKGFSDDTSHQIKYSESGNSAEWQANTFAGHLVLPSLVVGQFDSAEQITELCNVWDKIAKSRFADVHDKRNDLAKRWAAQQTCMHCGNLGLIRFGTSARCKICQTAYSC